MAKRKPKTQPEARRNRYGHHAGYQKQEGEQEDFTHDQVSLTIGKSAQEMTSP